MLKKLFVIFMAVAVVAFFAPTFSDIATLEDGISHAKGKGHDKGKGKGHDSHGKGKGKGHNQSDPGPGPGDDPGSMGVGSGEGDADIPCTLRQWIDNDFSCQEKISFMSEKIIPLMGTREGEPEGEPNDTPEVPDVVDVAPGPDDGIGNLKKSCDTDWERATYPYCFGLDYDL